MSNQHQSEPSAIQPRNPFFIGREVELRRFARLLENGESLTVLNVCGHSGVGKTWLLEEYCHLCNAAQVPFAYVNPGGLSDNPTSLLISWAKRLGLPDIRKQDSLVAIEFEQTLSHFTSALCNLEESVVVLMVDDYAQMLGFDTQIRQLIRYLARSEAPTGSGNGSIRSQRVPRFVLVIGSKSPLANHWPLNPLYRRFLQTVTLLDFKFQETCEYLGRIGVPERYHHTLFRWTRGYPMALALAATLDTWPEVNRLDIDDLLPAVDRERLVQAVLERATQGPAAQAEVIDVLRASALVRSFDQRLLTVMMGQDRLPDELFDQVTALAMVVKRRQTCQSQRFVLHPMLREAVLSDARRRGLTRDLEIYRRRAFNIYTSRRPGSAQTEPLLEWALDVLFLHGNPAIHELFFRDIITPSMAGTVSFHEFETALDSLMRASVLYKDIGFTGLPLNKRIEDTHQWLALDWEMHGETLQYFHPIRCSDEEIAGFSLLVPLTDITLPLARQDTLGKIYEANVGPLAQELGSYFVLRLVIRNVENLPAIIRTLFGRLITQPCERLITVIPWPLMRMLAEELGFVVLKEGIEHEEHGYTILELNMAQYGDSLGWLLHLVRDDLGVAKPQMPWKTFVKALRKVLPDLWKDVEALGASPLVDELDLMIPGMSMHQRAEVLIRAICEAAEMLHPFEEDEDMTSYSHYMILDALYGLSKVKRKQYMQTPMRPIQSEIAEALGIGYPNPFRRLRAQAIEALARQLRIRGEIKKR